LLNLQLFPLPTKNKPMQTDLHPFLKPETLNPTISPFPPVTIPRPFA
jgi:hypothetical protein